MLNEWKPRSTTRKYQSGQIIVLIALLVVGLLAIAGLAIDAGGLLLLKRDVQNATDAALLAATYAMCLDPADTVAIEYAGMDAAKKDGFDNSGLVDDGGNIVEVNYPSSGGEVDMNGYPLVEVKITARKPKYLIQIVYSGKLDVTTRALGVCTPPIPAAVAGGAVSGTGAQGCPNTGAAVSISGSEITIVGGVFGNGNVSINPSNATPPNTLTGDVSSAGDVHNNNMAITGTSNENQPIIPVPQFYKIEDFRPGGKYAPGGSDPKAVQASDYFYYKPGSPSNTNGPGLTFGVSGSTITFDQDVRGLIVVEGLEIKLDAQTSWNPGLIHATFVGDLAVNVKLEANMRFMAFWNNLGVFSEVANSSLSDCSANANQSISVTGKADFNGLIYAPKGAVSFSFSDGTFRGGIIARLVNISGSKMLMVHDPSYIPPVPPYTGTAG